ncbi:response regulator [Candidatus Nomurabacteria bacterium]|nr:response regulator [Candidatus Nomurabacteria bacterium]
MSEQKVKILFVDDDSFLRKVYDSELTENNYDVALAVDGQDGLDKARDVDPDLIILDMVMPKKNGFEVLTELQSDPETAHIPVIILSNLGQAADRQKGLDLGAVDYLVKDSTTLGVIMSRIDNILHSHTSSKEVRKKSHEMAIKEASKIPEPEKIDEAKTSANILTNVAKQLVKKSERKSTDDRQIESSSGGAGFQFCPECGSKIKINYKFCPKCGYKLEK